MPVSSLRAQAKQSTFPREIDCFVAYAPRNDASKELISTTGTMPVTDPVI
jgi:hypothetical protein